MFPNRMGLGSRGPAVVLVRIFFLGQAFGNGFVLGADLLFDETLERAIKLFQEDWGLSVVGEIDLATRECMFDQFGFDLPAYANLIGGRTRFVWVGDDGKQKWVVWDPNSSEETSGTIAESATGGMLGAPCD
jgi:hypothetical protein